MVIKGGKFMSAYSSSQTFHSMTSLVCNNRTGELYLSNERRDHAANKMLEDFPGEGNGFQIRSSPKCLALMISMPYLSQTFFSACNTLKYNILLIVMIYLR
jgi:hypothetical protein